MGCEICGITVSKVIVKWFTGHELALAMGDTTIFQKIVDSTFDSSKNAFEISLGLTGVLALWLGIMKIGEKAGVVNVLARALSPVFTRLFPDIPKNHPVMGSIFMNIASNMLGLDNAATPTGLKAMQQMQELNTKKDTATNPMIMFLVLNTSGLTIIPTTILAFRASYGAAQPTDVFIPILIATLVATLAGIIITSLWQRINILQPVLLATLLGMCAFVGIIIWGFGQMDKDTMNTVTTLASNMILLGIILCFILAGFWKKVNVYDAFIEGAKEGFTTAVKIIPYLVAILVGIGVFRMATHYQSRLAKNVEGMIHIFGGEEGKKLTARNVKIIREIAERTESIERGVEALVDARKVANKIESEREKAVAYHDTVAPKMEEIRYQIDKLELLVADELWTLPKYRELLFIR